MSAIGAFGALQAIAWDWGVRCFGLDHMRDPKIRALRFLEEALELAQACGVTEGKASLALTSVYQRKSGETMQEFGGCMVTLSVLAYTLGYNVEGVFLHEVTRCISKSTEHFAKRNEEKLALGLD